MINIEQFIKDLLLISLIVLLFVLIEIQIKKIENIKEKIGMK